MVARVDCTYGLAVRARAQGGKKKGGEFEGVSNSNSNSNAFGCLVFLFLFFFFLLFLQNCVCTGQGIRIFQRAKKKIA